MAIRKQPARNNGIKNARTSAPARGSKSGEKPFGKKQDDKPGNRYASKGGSYESRGKKASYTDRKPADKPAYGKPVFRVTKADITGEKKAVKKVSTWDRAEKRTDKKSAPRKYSSGHSRNLNKADKTADRELFVKPGNKVSGFKKERTSSAGKFDKRSSDRAPRSRDFSGDKPTGKFNKNPLTRGSKSRDFSSEKPASRFDKKTSSYGSRTRASREEFSREDHPAPGRFEKKGARGAAEKFEKKTAVRGGSKSRVSREDSSREERPANRFEKKETSFSGFKRAAGKDEKKPGKWAGKSAGKIRKREDEIELTDETPEPENIRLNRYIANAGISSRREADKLISSGLVSVNGEVITEMGHQVKPGDDVRFNGQRLSREKKVYILMNKPKDAITTLDDPEGRNTVMDVLGNELSERVFPVGRLDRNTTGVLLLTNDGELAQRLMHPKYEVEKVYKATLNKVLKGEDLWQLTNGVELEDGFIKPDDIAFPDAKIKSEVGVQIHSGRNRIIHRMFEHLGYLVDKLDRVSYGGFVKTGMKRGEWRHLNEKEIKKLKRMVRLG